MVGVGYNSGQFYGADKRPLKQAFIGGMQDNGTWRSSNKSNASLESEYLFQLGGDGFETIWNNLDDQHIIGSSQYNNFTKSIDGGATWINATAGISSPGSAGQGNPFISKLANSNSNPFVLYSVAETGVYRSLNFGDNWELTPINSFFGTGSFLDVEVSKSNFNIVWAGSGMSSARKMHVSIDGGESYTATENYSPVLLGSSSGLETHPTEDSTAYVLFSFSNAPKILRTEDLGLTWEDISGFGTNEVSNNGFPNVAVYSLLVRPDDPDIL